jgi:hypothetical protein
METKFLEKCRKFAIATLRWGVLTFCILLCLGIIFFGFLSIRTYYRYVWGPTPRIEADYHGATIEKVDGFYLKEGESPFYKIRTFPDCKIKFYGKILTVKGGDIYDRGKCVTDKVSIKHTGGKYIIYYQRKCTPLTSTTKFAGLYHKELREEFGKRDVYIRDGVFYYDKDERHGCLLFILLAIELIILGCFVGYLIGFGSSKFEEEINLAKSIPRKIGKIWGKAKNETYTQDYK